jgi:hypothetical protein
VAGLAHPRRRRPGADAAALMGIASLGWVGVAWWPDAGLPAWPAASLGLAALWLARRPGPPGRRALATVSGTLGLLLAAVQIALLWVFALFTP